MDYATAVAAFNAIQEAMPDKPSKDTPDAEWDAYMDARIARDTARDAMDAAYAARMGGYVGTIRRA